MLLYSIPSNVQLMIAPRLEAYPPETPLPVISIRFRGDYFDFFLTTALPPPARVRPEAAGTPPERRAAPSAAVLPGAAARPGRDWPARRRCTSGKPGRSHRPSPRT